MATRVGPLTARASTPSPGSGATTRRRRRRFHDRKGWLATVLGLGIVIAFIAPFAYMVLSAFKTPRDNIAVPPKLLFEPTLMNFQEVIQNEALIRFLGNSLIVATAATAVALLFAVPAAYGLVRLRIRWRHGIAFLFLALQLLPPIAVVFPYFDIADSLGIYDTFLILVVTYTLWNVAWGIWLIRGFIEAVPADLEECAMVDGASRLGAMLRITLPLAAPGLTAAAVLLFIGAWNEFTLAFFLTSRDARTYPTSIGFFLTHSGVEWGPMFVTAFIGTIPIVVVAFLVRRYFIRSLSFGAVKG